MHTCITHDSIKEKTSWSAKDRTFMGLVHEFEEFVDDRLQELPMRLQEPRILADDIHDVRGDDGFVVLPSLELYEAEQFLDDSDEESLLLLLI